MNPEDLSVMPFATIFAVALALAMDALAVALATGLCLRRVDTRQTVRMSLSFGLFQALMPVLGWFVGLAVREYVEAYGAGVAAAMLGLVGGKMIWEGLHHDPSCETRKDPTTGVPLLLLSLATSLDALAVGLSFSVLGVSIWMPSLVIGVVCLAVTAIGLHAGRLACRVPGLSRYAEIMGGVVLIAIGVNFLF